MVLHTFLCVFAIVIASVAADDNVELAPLYAADSPTAIDGEYVVVLKEYLSNDDVVGHMEIVRQMFSHRDNRSEILSEYHLGSFHGYGAKMNDKLRDIVRSMSHVKYVERSQVYKAVADCDLQVGATWGIVRTTAWDVWPPVVFDYSYDPDSSGEGVDAYIIDTGIYLQHPDFGGRAKWGFDAVDDPSPETDGNGHGTHVAGTVMSDTYGLAKKATAIAVRVLNNGGSGSTAGVINGIVWVGQQHSSGKKSVANMSLGGGTSTAMNEAVNAAVEAGVSFSVSAGNDAFDACNKSPASSADSVTVGATDQEDKMSTFSNYGKCVDIYGPGTAILSTYLNGGTATLSGTSMAAPHVAGVMAKYLSEMPASTTPKELKELIKERAIKDTITGLKLPDETPNLLIFKDCA